MTMKRLQRLDGESDSLTLGMREVKEGMGRNMDKTRSGGEGSTRRDGQQQQQTGGGDERSEN